MKITTVRGSSKTCDFLSKVMDSIKTLVLLVRGIYVFIALYQTKWAQPVALAVDAEDPVGVEKNIVASACLSA